MSGNSLRLLIPNTINILLLLSWVKHFPSIPFLLSVLSVLSVCRSSSSSKAFLFSSVVSLTFYTTAKETLTSFHLFPSFGSSFEGKDMFLSFSSECIYPVEVHLSSRSSLCFCNSQHLSERQKEKWVWRMTACGRLNVTFNSFEHHHPQPDKTAQLIISAFLFIRHFQCMRPN